MPSFPAPSALHARSTPCAHHINCIIRETLFYYQTLFAAHITTASNLAVAVSVLTAGMIREVGIHSINPEQISDDFAARRRARRESLSAQGKTVEKLKHGQSFTRARSFPDVDSCIIYGRRGTGSIFQTMCDGFTPCHNYAEIKKRL